MQYDSLDIRFKLHSESWYLKKKVIIDPLSADIPMVKKNQQICLEIEFQVNSLFQNKYERMEGFLED